MLFEPLTVGQLSLRNRLVMPPMVMNYSSSDGATTARHTAYLGARARGGIGLIMVEAAYIEPRGRGYLGELGIYDDTLLSGLRELVSIMHREGAKVAIQLMHSGRRTSSPVCGGQPVGPSPIAGQGGETPRELKLQEIEFLVECYGKAGQRAKDAGFDAVEVHMAHGYLLNQFISPISNRRTDQYGGSLENRLRFPLAVLHRVREAVGARMAVLCRISADEFVDGGMGLADMRGVALTLVQNGADIIDVSAGIPESVGMSSRGLIDHPGETPQGYLLHLAQVIKQSVAAPTIGVGRISDPEVAERALQEGQADLIGIGRGMLVDPEWPCKVKDGRASDIVPCTMCLRCHQDLQAQIPVTCPMNPSLGREA